MTLKLSPNTSTLLETAGTWCIRVSVVFLLILFFPIIFQEARYYLTVISKTARDTPALFSLSTEEESVKEESPIDPVDQSFGIVIPKINANSRVVADVDWQDARVYQKALTQGVAHARGSALPGGVGNTFLFAHAGASPLEAFRYNAVFYLIDKLEAGDRVDIWYQGDRLEYRVTNKKIVRADEIAYLNADGRKKSLTLMTCWPAGTTWKRLIVQAEAL